MNIVIRNKRLFSPKFRNGLFQGSNSNWALWPSEKPVVCGGTNGYQKATVWCGCGRWQFVCCWRQRWSEDTEYRGVLQSKNKTVESGAIHEYPSSWIGCSNFERPSLCRWWPWWLVLLEYCWEVRYSCGTILHRGQSLDLYVKVNVDHCIQNTVKPNIDLLKGAHTLYFGHARNYFKLKETRKYM